MGTLYIVATPVGNLEDITLRALRVLKEVDFILCEDTRVTRKLLQHYQISTPLLSYHQHTTSEKIQYIIKLLEEGKNLALVCDAGTPGISDPGNELVHEVDTLLPHVQIVPIPGPSALIAAASISGFPMDRFLFVGYPPHKKKRRQLFEEILKATYPVMLFESPHRILKTLKELQAPCLTYELQHIHIVVCRELTKKFETIYRGTIEDVLVQLSQETPRGEFVIILRHTLQK